MTIYDFNRSTIGLRTQAEHRFYGKMDKSQELFMVSSEEWKISDEWKGNVHAKQKDKVDSVDIAGGEENNIADKLHVLKYN